MKRASDQISTGAEEASQRNSYRLPCKKSRIGAQVQPSGIEEGTGATVTLHAEKK